MENPHITPEHQALLNRVASTLGYYVDNGHRCGLPHSSCDCPLVESDRRSSGK